MKKLAFFGKFVWWLFFVVCAVAILGRVFSPDHSIAFNFGGMPLN